MSIKNILCAYSGEGAHGSGLAHAFKLTHHHDGWLTGVMRHEHSTLEKRYSAHFSHAFLDELRAVDRKLINEVNHRFITLAERAGLADRSEFVELDPTEGSSIPEFARSFDLIVTGVHSDSLSNAHLSANPDLIALQSGRPVLVVPDGYEAAGLADRAVVAWDGKRSAARAVGDALSILAEKAKVTLVTIGKTAAPGTDRLLHNMRRHGIDVELMLTPRKSSIARSLLDAAQEVSAQLLVMGAFEHSRFSHSIKGGPTTDIIARSNIPVFLSH
ncbi:universal stress protein [Ruegeria pomeroyi]|nr:universal stress protein [Ruegeria pomeroyi]